MQVEVGPNETTVTVGDGLTTDLSEHTVAPDKIATIPVPPVPGGTILKVTVGTGASTRTILVEVIAPTP